jgi:hypothetical protein
MQQMKKKCVQSEGRGGAPEREAVLLSGGQGDRKCDSPVAGTRCVNDVGSSILQDSDGARRARSRLQAVQWLLALVTVIRLG